MGRRNFVGSIVNSLFKPSRSSRRTNRRCSKRMSGRKGWS